MPLLLDVLPELGSRVPWLALGRFPSAVERATRVEEEVGAARELWLKRDDRASSIYGGNKLRLLELLLARAIAQGARKVLATGAVGSNFTLAATLHARELGLEAAVLEFAAPLTPEGADNQRRLKQHAEVTSLRHWSVLPLAVERARRIAAPGSVAVLQQVGTGTEALLGYVSAGLELARQVKQRECPAPGQIVLPIGSANTSAGLAAGLALASVLGMGIEPAPELRAVRIAPWPLSRRARVLGLARSVLELIAERSGRRMLRNAAGKLPELSVIGAELGRGYPFETPRSRSAVALFARAGWPILEPTYSGKAAAHAFELLRVASGGPLLFWCTKSTVGSAPAPGGA